MGTPTRADTSFSLIAFPQSPSNATTGVLDGVALGVGVGVGTTGATVAVGVGVSAICGADSVDVATTPPATATTSTAAIDPAIQAFLRVKNLSNDGTP